MGVSLLQTGRRHLKMWWYAHPATRHTRHLAVSCMLLFGFYVYVIYVQQDVVEQANPMRYGHCTRAACTARSASRCHSWG